MNVFLKIVILIKNMIKIIVFDVLWDSPY